jgi:anti-sigma factor RsiW
MPHLDEGTIHTWLDGQLPPDEARSVEAHVAECRQCAAAVAEARGLIAASSRILTALDSVPREVVPKQPPVHAIDDVSSGAPFAAAPATPITPTPAAERARRRWFSGASLAAAAVIVVGIGTVAVMRSAKNRADLGLDQVAAVAASPGPRADTTPLPVVATRPAAPRAASENSLGDRRSAASVPQAAPAPGNAPAERDVANEAGRAGAVADARERLDAPKRLAEARQLADAPPAAPSVARAKVEQQVGVIDAKKAADELAKDTRQQEPSGRVALRGNVAAQPPAAEAERTITIYRARSLQADAASAARLDSVGSVRGRVTDANNTGIGGVMVTIAGTTTGAVTNSAGEFTLGGVQGGRHQLVVRQVGYQPLTRDITVTAGQTLTTDVVLTPTTTALSEVVVTGAQQSTRREQAGSAKANAAPPPPSPEVAPGAPITAAQSNAVGCYDLGITPLAPSRTGFRGVPRRIALDAEIVPANAGGIWYRARDLARTNAMPNGLWRPSGPTAVEIEWTYGSRTGRVTLSGPAGSIMRGTVEEIDRATATGEAGTVVALRRPCDG